ncbi:branched-chain amino acid ABC transporter permease [Streptomyces sp. CNQ085]|uniref:branched-chain amino acid ABC transporter permease n=1 Tax=Streptomyces sp. CNQ085 TaxID=2886944 RepID=UPI001F50A128|nr:branched-chain amino acid ABC transporter permease [Streptomyces sp. CNQ085]MCI0386363.1 branched-chain amino acid ABC transporter permease [Streptomyces sp. CNQ085]
MTASPASQTSQADRAAAPPSSGERPASAATGPGGSSGPAARPVRRWRGAAAPAAVLVVLALLPYSALEIPVLLDGPVNSPGSLQLLALCLVFGGIALGYDLMFGRTGLLSFGHALYVAGGAYGTQLAMTGLGLGLLPAIGLALAGGTAAAVLLGAVSLRGLALGGIGFAMVTLAFAQAGSIWVQRNPGGLTGGEEGLPLHTGGVPDALVGVQNTANVYWLALAYLALTAAVVWTAVSRPVGRVWQGIRDNEQRLSVLGYDPFRHKLGVFVLASALGVLGGAMHLLVTAGATPRSSTPEFTLTLLVMVVLGGSGTRWGPLIGGVLFTFLDQRLAVLASSDLVHGLPGILRAPLSEPMVVLGTLFVIAVYAAPGGIASIRRSLTWRRGEETR